MAHHPGLLQAILADPDDDAPRLVYADWLEENDDTERANFIRIQCELAATSRYHPATRARWTELKQAEGELWENNKTRWLRELPDVDGFWWDTPFERGFVSRCKPDNAGILVERVDEWVTLPVCRGVRLTDVSGWSKLVASESLGEVRHLDIETWIGDYGVSSLVDSPFVHNLRSLEIRNNQLGRSSAAGLADSAFLANLHTLRLDRNHLMGGAAFRLIDSHALKQLRNLYLNNNVVGVAETRFLSESARLGRLERLSLGGNHLGDEGVIALAQSPYVTNLEFLALWGNGMTAVGVRALLNSSTLRDGLALDLTGEHQLQQEFGDVLRQRFRCCF